MINLNKINFININTPNKVNIKPAFGGKDIFIKTSKGNKMQIDKDTLLSFNEKTKFLPIGMDGVMLILGKYLEGNVSPDEFSKVYLDRTPILFKRIEFGSDKEAYSQSYKPEIDLIKGINPLCDDYINNSISSASLDENLNKLVENYVKTSHKRGKIFVK